MALQLIDIGTTPNDNTGDPLRTAFDKVNQNDQYLEGLMLSLPSVTVTAGGISPLYAPHLGRLVIMDGTSDQVLSLQPVPTSDWPVGSIVAILRVGSGVVSVSAFGGVSLNGVANGSFTIPVRYSLAALVKVGLPNTWALTGGIG